MMLYRHHLVIRADEFRQNITLRIENCFSLQVSQMIAELIFTLPRNS